MTLERRDKLELLAADGLATSEERAELQAAGIDPDGWQPTRAVLQALLRPALVPDLVDGVMARVAPDEAALHDRLRVQLRQLLDAGQPPELASQVLAALDLVDADLGPDLRRALATDAPDLSAQVLAALPLHDADVGPLLRQALAVPAPDLADDVMAALDLDDGRVGATLRDALAADAPDLSDDIMAALGLEEPSLATAMQAAVPPAPDLADDIMGALGIVEQRPVQQPAAPRIAAAPRTTVAPVVPLRRPTPRAVPAATRPMATPKSKRPGLGFPAIAVAAAAALMLVFTGHPLTTGNTTLAFELAPINHVDIEELNAGEEVMVQVLQLDDNAPTIIFIDELDPSANDGGTPL